MPDPTTRPEPVRWNVCPDCGERHEGGAACHPELQGTPVSSIPAHQQAGYDAVYGVIRAEPGDAWRNATIWRAVEAYRTAFEPALERKARAAERIVDEPCAPERRDPHPYVHLTYGQWEPSGHQCGDLKVGGCDEPIDERKITARFGVGDEHFIGWELRDCPSCAPPDPAEAFTTAARIARGEAEHWATEHAVLEYAGCNARHADWCAQCRIEAAERERDEALAALPDLIRVATHVSRGRSFANVEPYPDALARQALGALNDATIRAALDQPKETR